MPEWVIVAAVNPDEPVVLVDWIFGGLWAPVSSVKAGTVDAVIFRDRWRAKRQSRRLPRELTPRCLRRDRL